MVDDGRVVEGLIAASGVGLGAAEREQLAVLYAKFARDRATLAAVVLGETEPLTRVVMEAVPASDGRA